MRQNHLLPCPNPAEFRLQVGWAVPLDVILRWAAENQTPPRAPCIAQTSIKAPVPSRGAEIAAAC